MSDEHLGSTNFVGIGNPINAGRTARHNANLRTIWFLVVLLITGLAGFWGSKAQAAHGGTEDGVCMVDRYNVTKPASVDDLNCTSNDVSLALYEVVTGPTTCIAGEVIDVVLKGDFVATSAERWDVGVFISQDGGTPNRLGSCSGGTEDGLNCDPADAADDCVTGGGVCDAAACYSDYLHPVSADNTDLDLVGGFGPFYNGEIAEDPADQCADIQQGNDATFETGQFSILCQDSNADLLADVSSCTVWANSRSAGTANKPSCSDEGDVTAETTAKCTCDTVNIIGIEFREAAQIEVIKDLVPDSDPGLFNLQIDGASEATDVGDGGTTGQVTVTAGTSQDPGDTHTVGETAGTGTDLAFYTTEISCVDRGEATFDGGPPLTLAGAGPLDVPVDPNDDIVCTITNLNACETAVCDPTACATFACDPAGAVGNCDIVTYTPGVVCRAGSGDICDPQEVCAVGNVDCPADEVAPATTICNAGSGDICDPDESCSGVAGEACPADNVASATTVCRAGSGDICDPAESCSGNPDEACPADEVAPATTICNPGSGDICDPDESCSGVTGEACPADNVASATTVCRAGSGDICDPDESCSGNPDEACPADEVAPATTICNPGSGDICDPDESCSGVTGEACPVDNVASATTVCRAGSGDICDPDESCSGNPDEACPADEVAPATTICNPGSGDICDPDESCSGVTGEACPADQVAPATTICNPGSGDICDPDESCTGNPDEACPVDNVAPATTVCRTGSGDICDPDESCSGNPDEACPADEVAPATTICNPGSGDICDPDESCSGVVGEACPNDVITPATTICRPGSGDICDPDESCTGLADAACPDDVIAPATTICRPSSTGDEICDPSESCTGSAAEQCPDDFIAPEGTACGDQSTTECSLPDTCDGTGICEFNNRECGSATNSALCEYDMEPAKGDCSDGGAACLFDVACADLGGVTCTTGGDCLDASGALLGICSPDLACGADCEQSDQFRLLFSPDVQNWTAYRLNASNPGQTFYNLIYDATDAGVADVTLTVTVPYPYVTVGGNPLHVYDAETVGSNGMGCLDPEEALGVPVTAGEPFAIMLDDWIFGAAGGGEYDLVCDTVPGPAGSGFCTFDVTIANGDIPPSGMLYLNVHLDFGLKGRWVDANPYGIWPGTEFPEDRYDRHPGVSPWGSSDALVNTATDDGPLALADCQAFWFDHTADPAAGVCVGGTADGNECTVDLCAEAGGFCNVDTCEGGDLDGQACVPVPTECVDGGGVCMATPLFEDQLQNLNIFKQISGVFGRVYCADDETGFAYYLKLIHPDNGAVSTAMADDEGFYVFDYKRKGKPVYYTVELYSDAGMTDLLDSDTVYLQGNGWWDVSFAATDCAGTPVWESTVTYGKEPKGNK